MGKIVKNISLSLGIRPSELMDIDISELLFDAEVLGLFKFKTEEPIEEWQELAPISPAYSRMLQRAMDASSFKG